MHPATLSAAVDAAEAVLRRWIGLDVQTIGPAALERAVRRRMDACGSRDAASFTDRLQTDLQERDLLVEEIVVAESWFFREPQVFETLRRFALERMGSHGRRPLRILSVPCAAGEEPYSVAMTLLDAGVPASSFTIDAVDVSRTCLERATAATYVDNAFRTADLGFRDRWFQRDGSAARLADTVRATVNLSWGNVLDEGFAAGRGAYDVVFCRNLLIYLTAEARSRVERLLDRLLTDDGILVVGAAEPAILRGRWISADGHASFTLRRGLSAAGPPMPPARSSSTAAATGRPPAIAPPAASWPPRPGSADDRPGRPSVESVLREAGRLANLGRHGEALQVCLLHQRESGPTPEVLFLIAMLHQSTGRLDAAEDYLHKTLSLDPGHEEALLSLALAASRRGDAATAERYRHSAARAFARRSAR